MAKKRIEQPADDEQEPVEYENVEPEAVEETWNPVEIRRRALDAIEDIPLEADDVITKPGGPAVSLDTDERTYRVSFALPYGVLVALLDDEHSDADWKRAQDLGLLSGIEGWHPTELGQLVLDGIDQTAIRHKMLAAWREQHNRGVDSDKTGFKKA